MTSFADQLIAGRAGGKPVIGIWCRASQLGEDHHVIRMLDGSERHTNRGSRILREYMKDREADKRRAWKFQRNELISVLWGEDVRRPSAQKIHAVQRLLAKHGIEALGDWKHAEAAITLRLRRLPQRGQGKLSVPASIKNLLPEWLGRLDLQVGTRDPLGLQAGAEALADLLVPGLTVTTQRMGYYAFICWAISVAETQRSRSRSALDVVQCLERALVLAEFVHHDDWRTCPLIGSRSFTPIRERLGAQLSAHHRPTIPERIVRDQNSAGCFRLYLTSCKALGLLQDHPAPLQAGLPVQLTALGERCAKAFVGAISSSCADDMVAFALGRDGHRLVSEVALRDVGKHVCFSALTQPGRSLHVVARQALLAGNDQDAVRRCQTLQGLFRRQAVTGTVDATDPDDPDPATAGLTTDLRYLLRVFAEKTSPENRLVQMAACHELGSLVLQGLLAPVLIAVAEEQSVLPTQLPAWVAQDEPWASAWRGGPAKPTIREHASAILDAKALAQTKGAAAGSLYRRLRDERTWQTLAPELGQSGTGGPRSSAVQLLHGIWAEHADITEAWSILIPRLAERHLLVSRDKGTQPWFEPVQDRWHLVDKQVFRITAHSYRIRQFLSLVRDLGLTADDVPTGGTVP